MRPFKRPRVPTRDPAEQATRTAFARRLLRFRISDPFWKRVVFSDESWLTCNEMTSSVQWAFGKKFVYPLEKKIKMECAEFAGLGRCRLGLQIFFGFLPSCDAYRRRENAERFASTATPTFGVA